MAKKAIKLKDIIMEHYQRVHELEMDGLTVRVWKPRTMQQLPAFKMLSVIKSYVRDASEWFAWNDKATWFYGNPDLGAWDALLVQYFDPRRKTLDIYVTSILVRPFSREAYEWYDRHHVGLEKMERLMLMWDSREYDRIHGFDTSYGAYKKKDGTAEADHDWIYKVDNEEEDIRDTTPSSYLQVWEEDDENPVQRESIILRQLPDGKTEYHAIACPDDLKENGGTPLMEAAARCYVKFREKHPEVTEMRWYTDTLVNLEEGVGIEDEGESKGKEAKDEE